MIKDLLKRIPGAHAVAQRLGVVPSPANYRDFLLELLPRSAVGGEIGVHLGDFSARLLRDTSPRQLHLIDPWRFETSATYVRALYGGRASGGQEEMDSRYRGVLARFAEEIADGRVVVHRGDSESELTAFADGFFDWLYIDGNHQYEFVRRDLELAFAKTRPGGLLCGDDYGVAGWWRDGVERAVDEFVRERRIEVVALRNAQFVLRR